MHFNVAAFSVERVQHLLSAVAMMQFVVRRFLPL